MSQICQSCDIQILEEIRKFSIDNHIHQEVCGHPKNYHQLPKYELSHDTFHCCGR